MLHWIDEYIACKIDSKTAQLLIDYTRKATYLVINICTDGIQQIQLILGASLQGKRHWQSRVITL